MSIVKLQDFKPLEVSVRDGFVYYNTINLLLHLQTDFVSTKPFGIPKKLEYCKTDKDRQFIQLPLFDNTLSNSLKVLDKYVNEILGSDYTSFIKESKNDYPEYVKIKFDNVTKFGVFTDDGTFERVEYITIDKLKEEIKFYYPLRFLLCFTHWKYMGKSGIKIYASHIQAKEETSKNLYPDNLVD